MFPYESLWNVMPSFKVSEFHSFKVVFGGQKFVSNQVKTHRASRESESPADRFPLQSLQNKTWELVDNRSG